jgi:hypothetical protein
MYFLSAQTGPLTFTAYTLERKQFCVTVLYEYLPTSSREIHRELILIQNKPFDSYKYVQFELKIKNMGLHKF